MLKKYPMTTGDLNIVPKVGSVDSKDWQPFLVDNVPTGRFHVLEETSTSDGAVTSGIWEHKIADSPNGKFVMDQVVEEVFYVLQGDATVTFLDGTEIRLVEGSTFYFPRGSKVTWQTNRDFKKFFVLY